MGEPEPLMSVVVPSVNGWGDLEDCLGALTTQEGAPGIEVLVVDRVGPPVPELARALDPRVRVLEAAPRTTIPELRALGFRAAGADVVGVIEDHVLVPRDWVRRMLAAHAEGAEVVGGAVENAATDRIVDWAAFLCEYSHCLVPPPAGPAAWVTGNNVTYRRRHLVAFGDVIARGHWENELHDALREAGIPLVSRPDIRVGHRMRYASPGAYARQRFLYSRSYAGARLDRASRGRRAAYGALCVALPPVLFARVVRRVWESGRHRRELLRSLPLLVPFTVAWAAGEAVGAWFGPGDALEKVC